RPRSARPWASAQASSDDRFARRPTVARTAGAGARPPNTCGRARSFKPRSLGTTTKRAAGRVRRQEETNRMALEADASPPGPAAPDVRGLRGPLAFAVACFVVWGLAYGLLDVLNKHFQETLHVGKAQSTWLQMAYFGAYLLMSLPAGML